MSITGKINAIIKESMIAKDTQRLNSARNLKKAFMDASKAKNAKVDENGDIFDDEALTILTKMAKTLRENIELYTSKGKTELAESERSDLALCEEFLPKMLGDKETEDVVRDMIASMGVTDIKDMGKVIGAVNKKYKGQVDGAKVASLVKSMLS